MNIQQVETIHEYIRDNGLISLVEQRTKEKWNGVGSRPTYYNAVSNTIEGKEVGLVGSLMLREAESVMLEHRRNKTAETEMTT